MSFNGYLIKFVKSGQLFPHDLIAKEGYEATPLQRTEVKAYRDSNNLLHRITSPNKKTKIVITTKPLNLEKMTKLRSALNSAMDNSQQRKMRIEYWDDELLNYRTMTAYMPDTTYTPKSIKADNIEYKPIQLTFIEY
ncbi:MAG: hypothetical protein J1E85_09055 [Ruminococcus sp.]|nr:hypothetical protein [Ruminococcus sp.]